MQETLQQPDAALEDCRSLAPVRARPSAPGARRCHPHHTFPRLTSSPSPPLTPFRFESSTTLKV